MAKNLKLPTSYSPERQITVYHTSSTQMFVTNCAFVSKLANVRWEAIHARLFVIRVGTSSVGTTGVRAKARAGYINRLTYEAYRSSQYLSVQWSNTTA